MAKYVDGFVFVVPKNKFKEYKKMAEEGRDIWMRLGALSYFECMGEDLTPKDQGGGKPVDFKKMTKAKPNEDVWFSFIVFKSKKDRDEINKKMMEEMSEKYKDQTDFQMPFSMDRFAYGGFDAIVEPK